MAEAELSRTGPSIERSNRGRRGIKWKRTVELGKACTCLPDEVGWSRSENLSKSTVEEGSFEVLKWLRCVNGGPAICSDNGVKELEAEERDVRAELEQLKVHIDELGGTNAEIHGQRWFQPADQRQWPSEGSQ